ncbi:hypothetical protein EP7_002977 [Isosphaeraceae bacterium EP7]
MDRLNRTLAACGLGLLVATSATGCRSTKSEVPPGRPYLGDGRQAPPAVGFSTDPSTPTGAMAGMPDPNNPARSAPTFGPLGNTPNAMAGYGNPTGGRYGPPGTSGTTDQAPPPANLTPEYNVVPASTSAPLPAAAPAPAVAALPPLDPAPAVAAPTTAPATGSTLPAVEPEPPVSLPSAPPGSEESTAPSPN